MKLKLVHSYLLVILSISFLVTACSSNKPVKDWSQATLTTTDLSGISIRAIEVINDSTVYFAANNGQVGITHNLGSTWALQTIKYGEKAPSFRAIAHTQDAVFIMSIESPALLYKWKNGEKKLVYEDTHPDVFYDAMNFFDEKNGIALGDPLNGCFSILLTSDGGNTWEKLACEGLPKMIEGEAAYAASNTNISVVDGQAWFVTGGAASRVWHSKDKGRSWEVFDTPIVQGGKMTGIYSVDFRDQNNGIIIGGDWDDKANNVANKAITNDGGKTWKLIADGAEPGYKSCVRYVPNSEGLKLIAVGSTGISYSKDGGATWSQINENGFYTFRFVNETTIVLAGDEKFGVLSLN